MAAKKKKSHGGSSPAPSMKDIKGIRQSKGRTNSKPKIRKKKKHSLRSKSQRDHPTPLTFEGYVPKIVKTETIETLSGPKTKVTLTGHASGPIPNNAKLIETATLNPEVEYDEAIINSHQPALTLSVADSISGRPLSAAEVDQQRNLNKNWIPHYFINPMQDLDYLVIQAIARSTFIGPLMEALTKFEVGTDFKPELELINPDKDEGKNAKEIEDNQEIIDTLLGIDAQLNRDDDRDLDTAFTEKIAALITVKNMFNRGALIFGYDKPVKVHGRVYKEIPSSMKFAHPRDLGIIEVDPGTWRLKSVQWRNSYYMVEAKDMIYLWNPIVSAKTRNSTFYGDSLVLPMLDAGRVVRKNIGVNFQAMAEATWSGLFLMAIKPEGQDITAKQTEYDQIVKNMVRGGPNVLLEHPDDVKFQNVDFNPKVKEFQELTEAMLRYQVACLGLPHSMFYDEAQSNRATMIGKIQLATTTVINPMRATDGRAINQQWYQRWFRLVYKDKPELLEKFRIKMTFEDLRIEEWFDKVEAVNQIESRKELTDEAYGELVGLQNYANKVVADAETHPGGQGGDKMEFGSDGGKSTISIKKSKTNTPGGGLTSKEKKS